MIANKNPGNIIGACLLKLEEKFVDLCFRHVLTQQFAVLHYRNILANISNFLAYNYSRCESEVEMAKQDLVAIVAMERSKEEEMSTVGFFIHVFYIISIVCHCCSELCSGVLKFFIRI